MESIHKFKDSLKEITIGALLHDIGKVVMRATGERRNHQDVGGDFLVSIGLRKFEAYARNHHSERARSNPNFFVYIVHIADMLSASEREDMEGEVWDSKTPLMNILSKVKIKEDVSTTESYFTPLPIENNIKFPLYTKPSAEQIQKEYSNILSGLKKKLQFFKENENPNLLVRILEYYLSFVPSDTNISEGRIPDISLYDHLKTTAMIASSLYGYFYSNNIELSESNLDKAINEDAFLLIGGDISGIQNFIYNITSKGALKSLRARSMFLDLFTHRVVEKILEETGYYRCNIHFVGGGRFYLILPNTEEILDIVKTIENEANDVLKEENLKLIVESVPFKPIYLSEAKNKIGEIFVNLKTRIERRKLKPVSFKYMEKFFEIDLSQPVQECEVCGKRISMHKAISDVYMCDFCYSMFNFGKDLVSGKKYLVETTSMWGSAIKIFDKRFEFSDECPEDAFCFKLKEEGEKDLTEPPAAIIIPSGIWTEEKEFSKLAEGSKGRRKMLGIFRADIDNLGLIFRRGIKNPSLSRVSTLSRLLTMFFKIMIPKIIETPLPFYKNLSILSSEGTPKVAVVYAGGDDLFLVGAWNDIVNVAFKINKAFYEFTGRNKNITLSGGIIFMDEKEEIFRMADVAGSAEDMAKKSGKDAISFYRMDMLKASYEALLKDAYTQKWDEMERYIREAIERVFGNGNRKELSQSLMRKMKFLDVQSRKGSKDITKPYFYYYAARHEKAKDIILYFEKIAGEKGSKVAFDIVEILLGGDRS